MPIGRQLARPTLGGLALLALAMPAAAADLGNLGALAQGEFRKLSQDLGAAAAYKGVTPAEALGITGFDVGVELTGTRMEHSSLFALAGAGGISELWIPRLHIHKGLGWGIDIGASAAAVPDLSAALYGLDVRWVMMDDGVARPAVALRFSGSMTSGISAVEMSTAAVDLMISKKLTAVTPYGGVGYVLVNSKPGTGLLNEERFSQSRVFVGVNVNLVVLNAALEAEKTGSNASITAKLGWRF